jgi:hypothetical protein
MAIQEPNDDSILKVLRSIELGVDIGDGILIAQLCEDACNERVLPELKKEALRRAEPFLHTTITLDFHIAVLAFKVGYLSLAEHAIETVREKLGSPEFPIPDAEFRFRKDAYELAKSIHGSYRRGVERELAKDWSVDELDGPILLAALRTGMLKTTELDALHKQYEKDRDYDSFSRDNRLRMIGFPITFSEKDIAHLRHVINSEQAPRRVDDVLLRMGRRGEDAFAMLCKMVDCGPGTYEEVVEHFVVRFKRAD